MAIIAVITIPIILNVIENSRKGAAIDSAYGYKDAINKYYVSQMLDNPDLKLNGDYKINKVRKLEDESGKEHSVETSGTTPTNGYVTIENNEITGGCLTINDYKVEINGKDVTAEKGECEFLKAGTPKFFNPGSVSNNIEGGICTNYESTNSNPEIKSGCMKWYILNDYGSKVDLLLDHDTTKFVAWVSQNDFIKATEASKIKNEYGITYPNNQVPDYSYFHSKGPLTALKRLQEDTKDWSNSLKRDDSYSVSLTNIAGIDGQSINYTIDYSEYKARMIKAEEIAKITGQEKTELQDLPAAGISLENFSWIKENVKVYNGGYWTSSPYASSKFNAWNVNFTGDLYNNNYVYSEESIGLRPVITVSKSLLSQD